MALVRAHPQLLVETGDLNVAGTWELQAYLEMPGWKGRGEWSPLKVLP